MHYRLLAVYLLKGTRLTVNKLHLAISNPLVKASFIIMRMIIPLYKNWINLMIIVPARNWLTYKGHFCLRMRVISYKYRCTLDRQVFIINSREVKSNFEKNSHCLIFKWNMASNNAQERVSSLYGIFWDQTIFYQFSDTKRNSPIQDFENSLTEKSWA